jgi:hypothetical protein
MSKLASNNNRAIGPFTSVPPSPRLVYYDRGTKYYYPLIKPASNLTWDGYIYSYAVNTGDTFGVSLSNTKYVVPNKRVPAITYDIPAGTYTPSAFKSLIDKYISANSGRIVSNSFTAIVNNQPITVDADTTIFCVDNSSSGSRTLTYGVNFSGRYKWAGEAFDRIKIESFADNGVYVTQSKGIPWLDKYMNYNITVTSGINFK